MVYIVARVTTFLQQFGDNMSKVLTQEQRDRKNKAARDRRAAKQQGVRARAATNGRIVTGALASAPIAPSPAPVIIGKTKVKDAVLALYNKIPTISIAGAVDQLAPLNESSVRVVISDFIKDGTLKVVSKSGRNKILSANLLVS
jgi:hypothetical protein